MMKTFKCIDYQQGKILVDENNQYSKLGDLVVSLNGDTYKSTVGERALQKNEYVVIAQHNLNLEGIPFIELEEDDNIINLINKQISDFKHDLKESTSDYIKNNCEGAIFGLNRLKESYKAAQPKQFTLEQMKEAIEMARKFWKTETAVGQFTYEQIIQQLQPKIESVEIETEIVPDLDSYSGGSGEIFSTNKKEEYVTYQKDGRTYLKVNKINYENS